MNSPEEIQCLTYKPPMQLELLYRLLTHEQDYNLRPQLQKLNQFSQEEVCTNQYTLIDYTYVAPPATDFFSKEEVIGLLKDQPTSSGSTNRFVFQQPVAAVWDEVDHKCQQQYIRFITFESSESVIIKNSNISLQILLNIGSIFFLFILLCLVCDLSSYSFFSGVSCLKLHYVCTSTFIFDLFRHVFTQLLLVLYLQLQVVFLLQYFMINYAVICCYN